MSLETLAGIPAMRTGAPPRGALRAIRIAALAGTGLALGLVFGTLLVAIVATRVLGYEILTVRSASMEPALSAGDLIVVKPTAIRDVSEGDVVLFAPGSEMVPTVHRVAGINEIEWQVRDAETGTVQVTIQRMLVTQGDANELPDAHEVSADELRGEVWFSVPGAGGMTGMPTQWLLFGAFGLILAAWGGWEAWRWRVRT